MPRGVILGAIDQAPPLARALPDDGQDHLHLALVVEHPVDLVVVAGAEVAHHVLVAVEEHDGALVVQLVHLVEVGHAPGHGVERAARAARPVVALVEDDPLPHLGHQLLQHLVLPLAVRVVVAAEADHHQPLLLGHDGLVDVEGVVEADDVLGVGLDLLDGAQLGRLRRRRRRRGLGSGACRFLCVRLVRVRSLGGWDAFRGGRVVDVGPALLQRVLLGRQRRALGRVCLPFSRGDQVGRGAV